MKAHPRQTVRNLPPRSGARLANVVARQDTTVAHLPARVRYVASDRFGGASGMSGGGLAVVAGRVILQRLLEDFGPAHGLSRRSESRSLLDRLSDGEGREWCRQELERGHGSMPEMTLEMPVPAVEWFRR